MFSTYYGPLRKDGPANDPKNYRSLLQTAGDGVPHGKQFLTTSSPEEAERRHNLAIGGTR